MKFLTNETITLRILEGLRRYEEENRTVHTVILTQSEMAQLKTELQNLTGGWIKDVDISPGMMFYGVELQVE